MICWSCERAAGDGATCAGCGALLPPDAGADYFQVLGVPKRYALDFSDAEARFRELSRRFHPDKFAKADPRARRASLQRSVQLNEAWRTLKDPVRRAEYLLRLAGHPIAGETPASATAPRTAKETAKETAKPANPTGVGSAERARVGVPTALLAEILELREELGEARANDDDARVQAMAAAVRGRVEAGLARVADRLADGLARADDDPAGPPDGGSVWELIAGDLIAIRYFRRFLDEVAIHDEATATRREAMSDA
jgi:molecular chaperone HscB